MNYQVTLGKHSYVNNTMNYQVTLGKSGNIKVDVNTSPDSISTLNDVDDSNKQNNYLLVWNESAQKHEYISPFELVDRADGVNDDAVDYGVY